MTAEFILALAALVTAAAGFLKVKSHISEVKTLVNGNHRALEEKLDKALMQRDAARAAVRQQQRRK